MSTTITPPPAIEVVAPNTLPVTIEEIRRQANLAEDDTTHDAQLELLAAAATAQLETDINVAFSQRTMRVVMPSFASFQVNRGPLVSVSSVKYIDKDGNEQTLALDKYKVDLARWIVRFESNLPDIKDSWDSVKVDYVIGQNASPLHKAAILMLTVNYFENPDMLAGNAEIKAYERICRLLHRGSYP